MSGKNNIHTPEVVLKDLPLSLYSFSNPEIHPPVVFSDPYEEVRSLSMEMDSNHYRNRYYPKVTEGSLIMFPCYLEHFVKKGPPIPWNYPRITIAFNLTVTKYGERTANKIENYIVTIS